MTEYGLAPGIDTPRYARCIAASKRMFWDIDRDVIRDRNLETDHKFLSDGLSLAPALAFLSPAEMRYFSRIQGRTYAAMFGLVERFINAKVLEVSRDNWLGDQTALEALVRFSHEEIKHQELFRRLEGLADASMPPGYRFVGDADEIAQLVLSKSTWAVLALTLFIELFTQAHYRQNLADDEELSPLFRDVFLYHWREESQHAIIDEMELRRIDATLSPEERNRAVDELIDLVVAVDGLLQSQASVDAACFVATGGRVFDNEQVRAIRACMLRAYRWQYILSGARQTWFPEILGSLITAGQEERIKSAFVSIA
ncbi:MAG: diiron oxygenase [Defluviicoccus sp.]